MYIYAFIGAVYNVNIHENRKLRNKIDTEKLVETIKQKIKEMLGMKMKKKTETKCAQY